MLDWSKKMSNEERAWSKASKIYFNFLTSDTWNWKKNAFKHPFQQLQQLLKTWNKSIITERSVPLLSLENHID